jgi:hypothetical protein
MCIGTIWNSRCQILSLNVQLTVWIIALVLLLPPQYLYCATVTMLTFHVFIYRVCPIVCLYRSRRSGYWSSSILQFPALWNPCQQEAPPSTHMLIVLDRVYNVCTATHATSVARALSATTWQEYLPSSLCLDLQSHTSFWPFLWEGSYYRSIATSSN